MKTRIDVEGVKAANHNGNNSLRYGVERKEERILEVNEDEIDNLIYGKDLTHTTIKDLINESLSINYKGKSFKIKVIEEVRDISSIDIKDNNDINQAKNKPQKGEDSMGMDILDGDGGKSGEDSNGDDNSSDEEEIGDEKNNSGGGFWLSETARWNIGEDGESRVLIRTKFRDSFEDDDGYSKKKMAAENNETPKELEDKETNSKCCDTKNEEEIVQRTKKIMYNIMTVLSI
nr:transposon TX1 [Tanacetum cinerariifolium]